MKIVFVVAVAENGVIGKDNALLWRLPDDLKYFKSVTMGKPVIMGRKTYDSIGRPLPGRLNIVISRQAALKIDGCIVVDSLNAALDAAGDVPEVAVIGGAEIYRQALSRADRVYLTQVHASFEGDVSFPPLPSAEWHEIHRGETHGIDDRHPFAFTFITLERRP